MSVPRFKFHNLKQGDIVRIRCVEVNMTTKRNVIQIKPYTNIIRFHPTSRVYQEQSKGIEEETEKDKMLADESNDMIMEP